MGVRILVLIGCLTIGSVVGACTTHSREQQPRSQPTVIHQDVTPPSSAVREGAREGAREGVRERGM
jgi:hypothetical protein